MELYCTRPYCAKPVNNFAELDDSTILRKTTKKFCTSCGMGLILAERYIPVGVLGSGGFGKAFLARDRLTPNMTYCVVKQFQPPNDFNELEEAKAFELFEQEGRVLEELGQNHLQIPRLLAFFAVTIHPNQRGVTTQNLVYLVIEYFPGATLEEELIEKNRFSETEVRSVLIGILPVLQYIHDRGVIHRDIKPANIIRSSHNGQMVLIDFGAVKEIGRQIVGATQTIIGTVGYSPPEQMNGQVIFPNSDLYALAATAIHLLSGQHPNNLYDNYNQTWNWRSQVSINPDLADILDRMLEVKPAARPQSAQLVLDQLQELSQSSLISPVPINNILSGLSRAILIAMIAGIGLVLLQNLRMGLTIISLVILGLYVLQYYDWIQVRELIIFWIGLVILVIISGNSLYQALIYSLGFMLLLILVTGLNYLIYRLIK